MLGGNATVARKRSAALRGVEITIILPPKNNLPFVHWAMRNMLWELLVWGIRVFYQPPPFVHTKLFVVDKHYAQVGSANIDPRSLRLNFELAVEVFDRGFVDILMGPVPFSRHPGYPCGPVRSGFHPAKICGSASSNGQSAQRDQ